MEFLKVKVKRAPILSKEKQLEQVYSRIASLSDSTF